MISADPHLGRLAFAALTPDTLPRVAEVEKTAYAHPWSLRHFQDSLAAGYLAQALLADPDPATDPPAWAHAPAWPDGRWLLGYLVAMPVLDEVHLLNITTVPTHRRQGHAQRLLQALLDWSRARQAQSLWLEVRESNAPARALYERLGFVTVGRRKGYYPDAGQRREDALVMQRPVAPSADHSRQSPLAAPPAPLRFLPFAHA